MCKKVFLDANIFIDLNDETRETSKESLVILDYLVKNKISIYTSCDLITTIYYILSKKSKSKALDAIEYLNKICKVIDFTNYEISQTCKLMRENKNYKDLEDTIQYILAKNQNCDLIISNDKNFYSQEVELLNSNQFMKKFHIK
ncbi:MAG: PIN domain-containing protein [Campylobacterota bacterium]|nr:PIN domain-containing protein [Campylobacterota bacterium]